MCEFLINWPVSQRASTTPSLLETPSKLSQPTQSKLDYCMANTSSLIERSSLSTLCIDFYSFGVLKRKKKKKKKKPSIVFLFGYACPLSKPATNVVGHVHMAEPPDALLVHSSISVDNRPIQGCGGIFLRCLSLQIRTKAVSILPETFNKVYVRGAAGRPRLTKTSLKTTPNPLNSDFTQR